MRRLPFRARANNNGQRVPPKCAPGYTVDGGGVCADIDECSTDNGGCDLLTSCTNTPGGRDCGPCPGGYVGDGESGCALAVSFQP